MPQSGGGFSKAASSSFNSKKKSVKSSGMGYRHRHDDERREEMNSTEKIAKLLRHLNKKNNKPEAEPMRSIQGETFSRSPQRESASPVARRSGPSPPPPGSQVIVMRVTPEVALHSRTPQQEKAGSVAIYMKPATDTFRPLKKSE